MAMAMTILVRRGTCMDRFAKTCLVLIVLLLTVIALRPFVFPQAVAAQQHYKYVAVRPSVLEPQPTLDKYAADGWELVGTFVASLNNQDHAFLGSAIISYTAVWRVRWAGCFGGEHTPYIY